MHSPAKVVSQKICLIGDFGVGKTSLIRQFVDRQFSDKYLSTVGVKISRKLVSINNLSDNTPVDLKQLQLIIWDIEGSTRFKAIAPSYLQGAKRSPNSWGCNKAIKYAKPQRSCTTFSINQSHI